MKKCMALLLAIALVCMFCSCNSGNDKKPINQSTGESVSNGASKNIGNNTFSLGYDDQPFYTTRSAMMVSSGEGYYFFVQDQLFYYDINSKTCVLVCGKPDCEHKNYALVNEDNQCNAFIPSDMFYYEKGFSYYDGDLYLLGKNSKDKYAVSIYRISPDGSEREEVCKIFSISDQNDIGEFAVHRGYAFCSLRTSESAAALYRVNLKSCEADIICEADGMASEFNRIAGSGNYIYFSKLCSEDDTYEKWIGKICRADIESGNVEEICDNLGSFAVIEESVYFLNFKNPDFVYVCDTVSKEVKELIKAPDASNMLLTDGKYLYLYYDSENSDTVNIVSTDGKIIDKIKVPNFYLIQGGGMDFLFVETVENGLQAFDKSKIGTGVYDADTVYSIKEDKFVLNQ